MRMMANGRRLSEQQVADLLDMLDWLDWLDLATGLLRQGYHLCPVRAPRRVPADGRLTGTVAVTPV